MYLLDVSVMGEMRKQERANTGVVDFIEHMILAKKATYLSVVTISELQRVVELAYQRKSYEKSKSLDEWISKLLSDYSDRILHIDTDIAQLTGLMKSQILCDVFKIQLAATAMLYGLTIVSRNSQLYKTLGAEAINPFSAPVLGILGQKIQLN